MLPVRAHALEQRGKLRAGIRRFNRSEAHLCSSRREEISRFKLHKHAQRQLRVRGSRPTFHRERHFQSIRDSLPRLLQKRTVYENHVGFAGVRPYIG